LKKNRHRDLERIQKELIEIMRDQHPKSREDRLFHDMMYSIELIREGKFDIMELNLISNAMRELRYSLHVFKAYYKFPKIAVFGSARTPSTHPDYKYAKAFGKAAAKAKWMVITGGASGIMEAAMVGAGTKYSFGLNIKLPFEQDANTVIQNNRKLMNFKYFFTRKLMFLKESAATVLFPGGFGTFDEGFESLTLVQTGKAKPRPIILIDPPGSDYWDKILKALKDTLEKQGWVSPGDLDFMKHYHDSDAAMNDILKFYSNYESSRFYKDEYLIRVRKPILDSQLKKINDEFGDLFGKKATKKFRILDKVSDDELKDNKLTGLIFPFNRSDYYRLRCLIDHLNNL